MTRRAAPRRVGAVAAVLAAAVVAVLGATPAPAGAQAAREPSVELVGQPSWLRPGERFDVRLRVTDAPADAALRLVVHDPLGSRRAFQRSLDGRLGDVVSAGDRQPLAGLPPGPGGVVTTGFAVGEGGVRLPGRGVYPVEVQLLAADGTELDTFVTYLDLLTGATPEFPPLDVAVVVDIGGPPALQPDGSTVLDDATLGRVRERVELLGETPKVPLTVAPQPETIDGLAGADGDVGTGILDALRADALGRRPLARPYVDVDLDALRQAGLSTEAGTQVRTGTEALQATLGTDPVGGIWLSGPTLGADAARTAVGLGYDRALVPPTAIGEGSADAAVPQTPVRLGGDGPLAMVSDAALAAHLTGDEGVLGAHRFLAELAMTWLEAPANARGVAVRLDADDPIDPAVVAVALAGLTDGQAVRAVPLDQLFTDLAAGDGHRTTVDVAPHQVTHDLAGIAPSLRAARRDIDGLGSLVGDAAQQADLRRALLVSTGAATPDGRRDDYIDRVAGALDTVSGAVTLPEQFRITLTARSSTIPVNVTNDTDRQLSVFVRLDSDQLEFPDGADIAVDLAPGTTRLDVPVRVRTSGAFTMNVLVTSGDGSVVLDQSTFDVRSTAISGVGFALSIGAGLFLAVWWLRNWRNGRRSRHLVPAGSTGGGPPEPGDPGAGTGGEAEVDAAYRPAHMARHQQTLGRGERAVH
jgi:hypothetical protein